MGLIKGDIRKYIRNYSGNYVRNLDDSSYGLL